MSYKNLDVRRKWFRERYQKNVRYVQAYKLEKGCTDCGYKEHHAGLQFDHVMPRLRGTVGAQMGKSLNMILEEIERCEVVCGTCHGIRTYNRSRGGSLVDENAGLSSL